MSKKNKCIKCFVYLATYAEERYVKEKEDKQLKYLYEYANAHNLKICKVFRRGIAGQYETNRQYNNLVHRIQSGEAECLLIANMGAISHNIEDAYLKVGKMIAAGGQIFSVDEGHLDLELVKLGGLSE